MTDLNFQQISTVQNKVQSRVQTITSATTIAPTDFFTRLTGTTTIQTITPPVTGTHMLAFVADGAANFGTSGNVVATTTLAANQLCLAVYDPVLETYDIGVLAAT
jgi:hypothetical protein